MDKLVETALDRIMEQHFDVETVNMLYKKKIIACTIGFRAATRASLALELEDLANRVTYRHNNAPLY